MSLKAAGLVLALVSLFSLAQAAVYWRTSFQYYLLPGPAATKNVVEAWDWWSNNSNCTINYAQFGLDLGLSSSISTVSDKNNSNFAVRIDFPSYKDLLCFSEFIRANSTSWKRVNSNANNILGIQYLATYNELPTGSFYRSSFLYKWLKVTPQQLADAYVCWTNLSQTAPTKPYNFFIGQDLNLGHKLFPDLPANYDFGGGLLFSSAVQLSEFYSWAALQPCYTTVTRGLESSSQIQWRVTFTLKNKNNGSRRALSEAYPYLRKSTSH